MSNLSMTDYTTGRSTGWASRTITGFFDDRAAAERTVSKLASLGVQRDEISLVAGQQGAVPADKPHGFWESLKDFFLPDEDRYSYAEGLRRGGYVVSAHVSDPVPEAVYDAFDDAGAIDMDEREASWRTEGWSGWVPGSMDDSVAVPPEQRIPPGDLPEESEINRGAYRETAPSGETPRYGRRESEAARARVRTYLYDPF